MLNRFYEEEVADSKLRMRGSLEAICPVCKAEAHGLVNVGAPSMTRYNHENRAPAKMNKYIVEETKRGKKTYLRICNAPNGSGKEWKDQPENRFLIGKDIFLSYSVTRIFISNANHYQSNYKPI